MNFVTQLASAALLLLGTTLGGGGCNKSGQSGGDADQPTVAVIPKGTSHEYWRTVKAGADAAGQEFGVKVLWKGPPSENDRAQQITVVETFVAQRVSGIVLAPLDEQALLAPVRSATENKIPVIIIDSALKGDPGKDFVSFVATNNHKGGQLAGAALAKALGDGPRKLVLLRYMPGSASTNEREAGFMEEIARHSDYQMISDNQFAGGQLADAQKASENMLSKLREADGIFCPNESSTLGMLHTLESNGLAGKVKFVGFDATRPLVAGLQSGEVDALVAQDPYKMGYTGVKTMAQHLKGVAVDQMIDTGVTVITRDNLTDPAVSALLSR